MNLFLRFVVVLCVLLVHGFAKDAAPLDWRVGRATIVITPKEFIWMGGYAARKRPAQAKKQDLYASALALQDAEGRRLLIIGLDLIGVPRELRDRLEQRLQEKHGLPKEGLLLNASHTHCGPELRKRPREADEAGLKKAQQAAEYLTFLEEKLVQLAGEALGDLQPSRLEYHHSRCGFAMNRRLPIEDTYRNAPNPEGPVDHDVPVLAVFGADNKLRAAMFGYACHNTTLSIDEWCGDYAGYAKEYFQAEHPGAVALFISGCGGDQNPYPRRKLPLVEIHGRSLATAVEAALEAPALSLPAKLASVYDTTQLDFVVPNRAELESRLTDKDPVTVAHARRMLGLLDQGEALETHYSYPVQVVRLGGKLTMIALAGEVVVDYSLRFKREHAGKPLWVAGYCNDVMGYIPSLRVLKEGGYEGGGAMRNAFHPGPWTDTVEERITSKVNALLKQLGE